MTRKEIEEKYQGKCALSGTSLKTDWKVEKVDREKLPVQREIYEYQNERSIEVFRKHMKTFHEKLKKLPKNPKTEKSKQNKKVILKIAKLFNITEKKPFSGKFYFEKETKHFLYQPPKIGAKVKVYLKNKGVMFGIVKEIKIVEKEEYFREIAVLEEWSPVPISAINYFLDEEKVEFE